MNELAAAVELFRRDPESGIRRIEWLNTQNPHRVDVLYALGECYQRRGRLVDAEIVWKRALEINPTDATVRDALARLSLRLRAENPPSVAGQQQETSNPNSARGMSELFLPSREDLPEYQRRRESKERVDTWATMRGAVPDKESEKEFVELLATRQRMERKATWQATHPLGKIVAVVICLFVAAVFAFVIFSIISG